MKFYTVFASVILAAAALPAPLPAVEIGADDLELSNNASSAYSPRNAGLIGFAAGNRGGEGGAVWNVFDAFNLRDGCNTVSPRIINIRGRIDLTQLFVSSPGVNVQVGPYKSIIGVDRNAKITGGGLYLLRQVHVIIRNIQFENAISYGPGEHPNGQGGITGQRPGAWSQIDCVDINFSEFVWVDHCEFSDDPHNANAIPENSRRHNGLVTVKQTSSYVSISNSIFRNHNMNFLIGHADGYTQDVNRLKVSVYLNWFRGTVQRNPLVRYGQVHVFNNLYTDISSYGIGIHVGAHVWGERNVFINTRRAWAFPIYNQPSADAHFRNEQNRLTNSGHDNVPGNVNWNPTQYYQYSPMAVNNVEQYVRSNAGPR